jgi:hypothetical protein
MRGVAVALLLAACGPSTPYIYNLTYSPNAGLVGVQTTISGSVSYGDQDNNISQTVVTLYDPTNTVISVTPPTPIQNVGQGVTGMVPFSIDMFTPTIAGQHRFEIYILDLNAHPSNILSGPIVVN